MTPIMYSFGQEFKANVTEEDNPDKEVSVLDFEDLGDYSVTVYFTGDKEVVENISTYGLTEKIYINGKVAASNMWSSYDKTAFKGSSALSSDFDFSSVIEENADLAKETGNVLKLELINKEDKSVLSTFEIKFNVPGFNDYESEFCGKLYDRKNTDEKVEKTLHTIFKAVYPHDEIVMTLMYYKWKVSEESGGNNSYMIVFKNKGRLWTLKYSASYVVEDGKLLDMPRVKIYNGLDNPIPLAESCFENLKANLK